MEFTSEKSYAETYQRNLNYIEKTFSSDIDAESFPNMDLHVHNRIKDFLIPRTIIFVNIGKVNEGKKNE